MQYDKAEVTLFLAHDGGLTVALAYKGLDPAEGHCDRDVIQYLEDDDDFEFLKGLSIWEGVVVFDDDWGRVRHADGESRELEKHEFDSLWSKGSPF